MDMLELLAGRARKNPKRVVLTDGEDPRALRAADLLLREHLASELFLLGDPSVMTRLASSEGLDIAGAVLADPRTSPDRESLSRLYLERHHRRLTAEKAFEESANILNFGCLLVADGRADCLIGGADHPTADLIRAAWWIIGMKPGVKTVSSSFLMLLRDKGFGAEGVLLYADCAVVPQPNPHQLADIAQASAHSFTALTGLPAVVALLSFSTKGSADHPDTRKIREAVRELESRNPGFEFDGEYQFDAAVVEAVGKKKDPGSAIAGRANVLVFPDLDAGNIGYKVTERLAGARAVGPLMQGLNSPVSDLSRGCSWTDIVDVAVVTQNMG